MLSSNLTLINPVNCTFDALNCLGQDTAELNFSRELLKNRNVLLSLVGEHFRSTAMLIAATYDQQLHCSDEEKNYLAKQIEQEGRSRDLPVGATRIAFSGLLLELSKIPDPYNLAKIWKNCHLDSNSDLKKFFGWSFNQMKNITNRSGHSKCLIKDRGQLNDRALPYMVHTHAEVPFILNVFNLANSELAITAAAGHDVQEEGHKFSFNGKSLVEDVDLTSLSSKFEANRLGDFLRVLIPALTETEFPKIKDCLDPDLLQRHEDLANKLKIESGIPEDLYYNSLCVHPCTFGGLALQIKVLATKLAEAPCDLSHSHNLSQAEASELIETLIAVEFADRISDIASFERYLENPKITPENARFRIKAIISRMVNMQESLIEASYHLDPKKQETLLQKLDYLPFVIAAKIEEVNLKLHTFSLPAITADEWREYHQNVFRPIQDSANELIANFMDQKCENIISHL